MEDSLPIHDESTSDPNLIITDRYEYGLNLFFSFAMICTLINAYSFNPHGVVFGILLMLTVIYFIFRYRHQQEMLGPKTHSDVDPQWYFLES